MRKLHIAFVSASDPSIAGGVQEHILHLSAQMRMRGHTVDIFGPEGKDKRFLHYHPISRMVDIPLPGGEYSSVNILNQSFDPGKVLNDKKYDLIHIHEPYSPFAMWGIIDKLSLPVVATFHTAWDDLSLLNIFNGFIPLFKDQFSKVVRGAIFVSRATRNVWKNICANQVLQVIIPNAVDITCFKPKKSIHETPTILFVARLVSRKGVLHLLKAAELLKHKGFAFKVTIIGTGKEKNDMLAYIKKNKMNTYVRYLGEIKGNERCEYFKESDIFCAPYINEAAPLAILEAISSGLPVVGFMNNAFKEILAHYPAKELLVKAGNDKALSYALETLLSHTDKRKTIKKWCIAQRVHFSWGAVAEQTEKHYYQILKKYEKKHL